MYQALYRKYRPRSFSDVAGQDHITETLRRQIISGRLSHAYLFVGTRGTGKTTCAKILAKVVNCLSPVNGDPCNKCSSCIGIENGSILDVLELDAASNNRVDDVRMLQDDAIYSPASVNKRVYILDEVHMLTPNASNALLKILEEPPEHLIFVLATTELHKVPATILSRCQRFSFKRLSPAIIEERIGMIAEKEGLTLTKDAAQRLAALADGSLRDGISLLDQCASDSVIDITRVLDIIGLAGRQDIVTLSTAIVGRDLVTALDIVGDLYYYGKDMAAMLNELAILMRDLLVFKLSPGSPLLSGNFSIAELTALSNSLSSERLFFCLDVIRETGLSISRSGGSKLSADMCIIRMCDERLSDDFPALLARIARLENGAAEPGTGNKEPRVEDAGAPQSKATHDEELNDKDTPTAKSRFEEDIASEDVAEEREDYKDRDAVDEAGKKWNTDNEKPADEDIADDSGGFWQDILNLLMDDPSVYAVLSDRSKVKVELQDNILKISADDAFTKTSIESGIIPEPLREAAGKVLGREIIIRVETIHAAEESTKVNKLNDLKKFGIVKSE